MNFQWIPGQGPNRDAIERMKAHFKKPDYDPREAWFMSREQRYFPNLLESVTTEPNLQYVKDYLFEGASGINIFGRYVEWVEWYHFLLPYLFDHMYDEDVLYQTLTLTISYFLNLYPYDIIEEYQGFRNDVLLTLPQTIMMPELWQAQKYFGQYWAELLNASMFFCLKYLKPDEVRTWVESIANIRSADWDSNLSQWIKGAKTFLYYANPANGIPQPKGKYWSQEEIGSLGYLLKDAADISWGDAHLVFQFPPTPKTLFDYWPEENLATFWEEIEKYPHLRSQ